MRVTRGILLGCGARYCNSPTARSTAVTSVPSFTNATACSISGARKRSEPGPLTRSRKAATAAPVPGAACPSRISTARAAVSTSIASTRCRPSTLRLSLRAAAHPIDTWSSCIAEDGIESTDAGVALRLSSCTIPAWAYCAIMCPESTPGSCARKAFSPRLRAVSRKRSVRRSLIDATSAATIAKKSSTYATGAPWKLPFEVTRPSGATTGLSTAAANSQLATCLACARVSRNPPATWGAQRTE